MYKNMEEEEYEKPILDDAIINAPLSFQTIKTAKLSKDNTDITPIGLYDDLNEADKKRAIEYAKENLLKSDSYNIEKNLKRDMITVPGQKYCVVCWVGPKFKAKTDLYGFRIMGAFKTLKIANAYVAKVSKSNPKYDVGVMEMNLWCMGYPDNTDVIVDADGQIDTVKMQENYDEMLNEFVIRHKTKLEETKQFFNIRKIAVKKSDLKTEGNIEDSEIDKIPEGPLTKEMEKQHLKEASKWIKKTEETEETEKTEKTEKTEETEETEYLDETCKLTMPDQNFAVISYIENTGKNRRIPISIKGVFQDNKSAEEFIEKFINVESSYDMIPVPLYRWIPCDPDTSYIKQKYVDTELNNMLEAEENQKEESIVLHNAKLTGTNMEAPLNSNYEGKGSYLNIENFDDDEEEDSVGAYKVLQDIEKDVPTTSFNIEVEDRLNDREKSFSVFNAKLEDFENAVKTLMLQGHTEKEAKAKLRLKDEEKKIEIQNIENIEPIEKHVEKVFDIEKNIDTLEDLIKKGYSTAEIREKLSK